jgi:hypothetical protein
MTGYFSLGWNEAGLIIIAFKLSPSLVRTGKNSGSVIVNRASPGSFSRLTHLSREPSDRWRLFWGGLFILEKVVTKWAASGEREATCQPGSSVNRSSRLPSSLTR